MKKGSKYNIIANRYARAIFELALDEGRLEAILSELELFNKALEEVYVLKRTIDNKEIAATKRHGIIREVSKTLSLSPLVCHTIMLLVDKDRTDLFSSIAKS